MSDWIHRKQRIVFTAIEVMNELGVQALSTKKVALYQNISESTVFKHYENKNCLMKAVLDFYCQYDADLMASVRLKELTGLEGIKYLLGTMAIYYENYPAITAIAQGLDEMRYIEALRDDVDRIISDRLNFLTEMVTTAQVRGEIDKNFKPEAVAGAFAGMLNYAVRKWSIDHFASSLSELFEELVECLLRGIQKR